MPTDNKKTDTQKPVTAPKRLRTLQWLHETDLYEGIPRPEDRFKGISPETHVPVYHGVRATDFIPSMERKEDSFGGLIPKEKPRKDPPPMLVHPASRSTASAEPEAQDGELKKFKNLAVSDAIKDALVQECSARGVGVAAKATKLRFDEDANGVTLTVTGGMKGLVEAALPESAYVVSKDGLSVTLSAPSRAALSETLNGMLRDSLKLNETLEKSSQILR